MFLHLVSAYFFSFLYFFVVISCFTKKKKRSTDNSFFGCFPFGCFFLDGNVLVSFVGRVSPSRERSLTYACMALC